MWERNDPTNFYLLCVETFAVDSGEKWLCDFSISSRDPFTRQWKRYAKGKLRFVRVISQKFNRKTNTKHEANRERNQRNSNSF